MDYSKHIIIGLLCVIAVGVYTNIVVAWSAPTATPPAGNVAAPINVSANGQIKDGSLGVNSLAVFGNAILSASNAYLNFGNTAGNAGYGFRDNQGALEYKNRNGNWTEFPSVNTNNNQKDCTIQYDYSSDVRRTHFNHMEIFVDTTSADCEDRVVQCQNGSLKIVYTHSIGGYDCYGSP